MKGIRNNLPPMMCLKSAGRIKHVFIKSLYHFASLLVALGIIYGDIGTSPLYVMKAIVGERIITETLVLGGVSCVFRPLVLQTKAKYIVNNSDGRNEGEGGISSLCALVRRYGKRLVIPTILGATTLLADGILRRQYPLRLPLKVWRSLSELVDDKIIKVNINIGFRVQPRSELFFKKIVQELVEHKELNLHIQPDGSTRYNPEPDFKFVIIEKFLSVENEFTLRDGIMLNTYFILKLPGQRDEKAFGLDKSDVMVEYIPFVYNKTQQVQLKRIY